MLGEDGFLYLLAARRRDDPNRLFARSGGAAITVGALGQMADSVAAGLRSRGISRGERVAVMLRNSPTTLATIFGLARAGVAWVPINAQYRGPGLKYILEHCEPRMVIADADLAGTIRDSGADLRGAPLITHGGAEDEDPLQSMLW